MKRLPRKRKKEVKKIVARKTATKMAMSALVTAQACAQTLIISATPVAYFNPGHIASKSAKVASVVVETASAISKILSEPPNSWRDFVK